MRWGLGILASVTACIVIALAVHLHSRSHPRDSDFNWEKTETGFRAQTLARNTQLVCICGGYSCRDGNHDILTDMEPTHLAYKGPRRIGFVLPLDPGKKEGVHWGRIITADLTCLEKNKGEVIEYTLNAFRALDSAGVNEIEYLKLSIK